MCDAWERRDYQELAELAHWLKGAGGTVGFADFTDPAKRLELLAKGAREDQIDAALEELVDLASVLRLDPSDELDAPATIER
jgi:HPt (histidine-containing phosphotransfer) domain-containing protein